MILSQYRYKCNTEGINIFEWRDDTEGAPTQCKTDPAHSIDLNTLTVVDTIDQQVQKSEIELIVGGKKTDTDGLELSANENDIVFADYVLPENYHLQGVYSQWENCQLGDYAWLALIHPSSQGNLAATANQNDTQVTVDAGLGAYYDPLNGAKYLEIWDTNNKLKEVHKISSVSGDIVTFENGLIANRDTTDKVKARYDGFSPVRGSDGLAGGLRLLKTGSLFFRNELGVTEAMPANFLLSLRLKTSSTVALRELIVDFIFRK